jgi:hypothetical protein
VAAVQSGAVPLGSSLALLEGEEAWAWAVAWEALGELCVWFVEFVSVWQYFWLCVFVIVCAYSFQVALEV